MPLEHGSSANEHRWLIFAKRWYVWSGFLFFFFFRNGVFFLFLELLLCNRTAESALTRTLTVLSLL